MSNIPLGKGKIEPDTLSAIGGKIRDTTVEMPGAIKTPETPEWGYYFVPQDAGGELLMPQDCPEMGGRLNAKR